MRKIICAALIVIFIFLFCSSAFAEDNTYKIDELKMEISVPDDWITFTKDTDENDPNLAKFGTDKSGMDKFLTDNNYYLVSICTEPYTELYVSATTSDVQITDYKDLSTKELEEIADGISKTDNSGGNGFYYTNHSLYDHPNAKFIMMDAVEKYNGETTYYREYYTVNKSHYISIYMSCYGEELTEYSKEALKNIIDGIKLKWISKKLWQLAAAVTTMSLTALVTALSKNARNKKKGTKHINDNLRGFRNDYDGGEIRF